MAVTVSNYRITPYSQKDGLPKVIFGGAWGIEITLPTAHESGDGYILVLDYERIVYPLARPVCAYSNDFALDGNALSMSVGLDTTRLAKWLSSIRKPTPICVQIVRVRGEIYETLLLDEILALPSVANGDAYADPHSPIMNTLAAYVGDGSTTIRQGGVVKGVINANQKTNDIIDLDAGGGGGGGSVEQATDAEIDARKSTNSVITPNNLDYAGRSVVPNITTIPSATTAYALLDATATTNSHSWQYAHAPTAASTYTLPAVADTAVAHYIRLTIDFASVQTYAFEDSEGTAIAPLFTPTISAGDVYEFDCEYSMAKSQWLIWPHKQGAVSDDYVMQSEVGAANGVAGLDANGLVPEVNIRKPGSTVRGAAALHPNMGARFSDPYFKIEKASTTDIDSRGSTTMSNARVENCPIVPNNLNLAVTAALTDSRKISLTDAQKASAQDTLGVGPAPVVFTTAGDAPRTSTVGAVGQLAVNTADGKVWSCEAIIVDETDPENPVTTYTWKKMVQLDANGKLPSGEMPVAEANNAGAVKVNGVYGVSIGSQTLLILRATATELDAKSSTYKPVVPYVLDYAVRSVLPNITEIPAATSAYTLLDSSATTNSHSHCYRHAPSAAPVYTLPTVTDATITHTIELTVEFAGYVRSSDDDSGSAYAWKHGTTLLYTDTTTIVAGTTKAYSDMALATEVGTIALYDATSTAIAMVGSVAFEDANETAIAPKPMAGSIKPRTIIDYLCEWNALRGEWVIMPLVIEEGV